MGFLEGYSTGGGLGDQRQRRATHESNLATAESGRTTAKLSQLQKLQELRSGEAKSKEYGANTQLREEERDAKIAAQKNVQLQAQQDTQARTDYDLVSRLGQAYSSNNQEMWEATLASMPPGTKEALDKVPLAQIPKMLEDMRKVAIQNLDHVRETGVIGAKGKAQEGVAAESGRQARMTGQQSQSASLAQSEMEQENANYRARIGGGVPGAIAEGAIDDPANAEKDRQRYVDAGIGALDRKGMGTPKTQQEVNAAYDTSVSTGMKMTATSMVTEYNSGTDVERIDPDDLEKIAGWREMTTQANTWVKRGASGSDVHDGLTGQFVLIDEDKGFIRMPQNARGEPVGDRTATQLLKEARDTGESIETIVRRHARYVKHTTGTTWDHGL